MPISINSNIASLDAQRRLGESTSALSKSYERLSSGLRVNTASDDAAGLAVGTSLQADTRLFTQAVRNVNDGISLTQIASGALEQVTNIVQRLQELAEQSANGTLTTPQRSALDAEGQALSSEYTRISSTTQFNGLKLLDGSMTSLSIQAGYSALVTAFPTILNSATGDGTFQASKVLGGGAQVNSILTLDVNGDGNVDLVTTDAGGGGNSTDVYLGNGNGTFRAMVSYAAGSGPAFAAAGDFNGDGIQDLSVADDNGGTGAVTVLLGNADGTFRAPVTNPAGYAAPAVAVADFNGDGKADLVSADSGLLSVNVFIGNGDGTFKAKTAYSVESNPSSVVVGDFNGDGKQDVISADAGNSVISVSFGNGDGTLKAATPYAVPTISKIIEGDFNGDGIKDLAGVDYFSGNVTLLLGNSNGSFKAGVNYASPTVNVTGIATADFNGDGKADLVTTSSNPASTNVWIGNGDGSFQAAQTHAGIFATGAVAVGDFNNDGAADLVAGDSSPGFVEVYLGNGVPASGLKPFSLLTQSGALSALTSFQSALSNLTSAAGQIGSSQSRLSVEASNIRQSIENYQSAASQIMDVDVAAESAELAKNKILQETGASVLAQANQQPALALQLLRGL